MNSRLLEAYREARKPRHCVYHTHTHLWQTTAGHAIHQARRALHAAHVRQQFDILGEDCVRIRWEPDDYVCLDDMLGDMFEPECYPYNPNGLEQARADYIERLERDGVWIAIAEYWDDTEGCWETADSISWIEGTPDDVNGYDVDLMQSAIEGFIKAAPLAA